MLKLCLSLLMFAMLAGSLHAHGPEGHREEAPPAELDRSKVGESSSSVVTKARVQPVAESSSASFTSILKNLHPAAVHFPIGLIVTAGVLELLAWRRRSEMLERTVEVMVAAGAVGAVAAAALGWIHTGLWTGGDANMQLHRWLGSSLALLAPALWFLSQREGARRPFRILLWIMAAMLMWQGFHGGELAHGAGHLLK